MKSRPRLLVVLSGVSGSGKSHFTDILAKVRGFSVIPSLTTRQPRPGEAGSLDRRFCSIAEFERLKEKEVVICGRFFFGNWYGLDTTNIDDAIARGDAVLQLTYKSLLILKARYPLVRSVYILPPSVQIAKDAVSARNLSTQETAERIGEIEDESAFVAADRKSAQPIFDAYFHNLRSNGSQSDFLAVIDALRQ